MDTRLPGSLEDQIRELRFRVNRLEATLLSQGLVPPVEVPTTPAAPGPIGEGKPRVPSSSTVPGTAFPSAAFPSAVSPGTAVPGAVSSASLAAPAQTQDHRSLENRIGSQWFNRIGILAVLIGVAWFLKLAFDNHWIGPLGRVLIGLLAGAALIAWSERFRSRGYPAFSYSLKAVGSGILYLSLWAAFSLFRLVTAEVAFAAMIAVTAFNGFMSWLQDAELLALYAIVGGLSTPLLLSTGENHEATLFTYVLILDLAVLVLVGLRPWSRLLFGAFTGTVLFFAGWWLEFYSNPQFGRTAFFLGAFFLVFAFAPRLVSVGAEDRRRSVNWDALALVLLPMINAAMGFLTFYALFDRLGVEWAGPWLAVGFAAFYLFLLRLPAGGVLRESTTALSSLHLATAVVFLTIAIPLKAHDRWLTIGWLAEGAALLWVAVRIGSELLRVMAVLCLMLGLAALIAVNPPASVTPFFNGRFGTYCAAIAIFIFVAWLTRKANFAQEADATLPWPLFSAGAALVVNALILLALGWEIHAYWWFLRWRGDWSLDHDYQMYAQFSYSALFMVFGAVLLGAGFSRRSAFLRWQALILLAASIGKVFLVDMSELSQGYRIISFIGLGALLLAVSFAYQRDWLNLRVPESPETGPPTQADAEPKIPDQA